MAIQYALFPSSLTSGDKDQRAMVQNRASRTTEDIIEEYKAYIAEFVAKGDCVNTP